MKSTSRLFGILVFALALVLLIGCAPKPYSPSANEEVYGTWVNPNSAEQKLVISPDGTWKEFNYPSDTVPVASGTFQLVKKWKDASGNTWYHEDSRQLHGVYSFNAEMLVKIDKTGKVRESIFIEVGQFDSKSYPKQLDPKSESYSIYYRTE